MLRVTTMYASSAIATASYYTLYLAGTPGEERSALGFWVDVDNGGRHASDL